MTFSALGFLFGKNLSKLDDYLGEVGLVMSALVVVGYLVYRWREQHSQRSE